MPNHYRRPPYEGDNNVTLIVLVTIFIILALGGLSLALFGFGLLT